jgi:hypothetical protein
MGHDDIRQHQMNRVLMLIAQKQRFTASGSFDDLVSIPSKSLTNQTADRLIVFHYQNGFRTANGFDNSLCANVDETSALD